jgi:hypothetical protein
MLKVDEEGFSESLCGDISSREHGITPQNAVIFERTANQISVSIVWDSALLT